ncbi:MAG: hypothetical protein AB1454_10365 [Candidatus Auribacterota bacterium]
MRKILFYITVYAEKSSIEITNTLYSNVMYDVGACCGSLDACLHAYCLLPTSFHALFDLDPAQLNQLASALQKLWRRLISSDTRDTSDCALMRVCPVEKNRFAYDLSLYIHSLPLFCGIVIDTAEYRFSSFDAYCHIQKNQSVDTGKILSLVTSGSIPGFKTRRYHSDLMEFTARKWLHLNVYSSSQCFGSLVFRRFVKSYMRSFGCERYGQEIVMPFCRDQREQ